MTTDVHCIRFYNVDNLAVKCMAVNEEFDLIALARDDNTIEIWNVISSPFIERTILATYGSVEALVWFERRLFSVGQQGSAVEYDLFTQTSKSMHPLTSGSSSCLSVSKVKKQLAAGTEDGYINLFDIGEEELVYNRLMDKQEGSISCLAWDKDGDFIVTGSIDTIRVWQVDSGHAIHRMTTGRSMNNQPTKVWSIVVTSDFTVITGDSRGKLCFWDGRTGVNISSYQSHRSEVLAVCLDEAESKVYCAGVDPLIATYERVKMKEWDEKGKWVKSIQRVIHEHTVRSLAICEGKLFSAGDDGYLALSSYPPKTLVKFPPLLQMPSVSTAPSCGLILLRYHRMLQVWKLPKTASSSVSENPVKLIEWHDVDNSRVKAAALSPAGSYMAVSTLERLFLYRVSVSERSIRKVKLNGNLRNLDANCLAFSSDDTSGLCKLCAATASGSIYVLELSEKKPPSRLYVFKPVKEKKMADSISQLIISNDGEYVIACDLKSNIMIWRQGNELCKLPRYASPVTCMNLQPSTLFLVVVYSDHQIVEYSVKKMKYSSFSRLLHDNHPEQWRARPFPVHCVQFDPRNSDVILLCDDSAITVINKKKQLPPVESKIPRLSSSLDAVEVPTLNGIGGGGDRDSAGGGVGATCGEEGDSSVETNSQHPTIESPPKEAFHVVKRFKHLVYFGPMHSAADGEMVAVEVSPLSLKENLPVEFKLKRFGKM